MPTKIKDRDEEKAKEVAYVAEVEMTDKHRRFSACQSLKKPSFPADRITVVGFPW